MGRYYYGSIMGKFWVAIQDSNPMEQFGAVELGQDLCFVGCSCEFDGDDESDDKLYCSECYESYEQHIAEVRDLHGDEEAETTWESNGLWKWTYSRDNFNEQGLTYLQTHQEFFDRHVASITFNKENSYEYDFEYTEGGDAPGGREEDELLADLCMLKQIQKFFDENPDEESCDWEAEY
jgi:hypothetical protein